MGLKALYSSLGISSISILPNHCPPFPSPSPSYLALLIAKLSTLFACASKYLQHVSVYLQAFVQLSSLFIANLIL